jgi:hypothetical protein
MCNSSDVKKTSSKTSSYFNPYFPTTVGNFWTYINEAPRDETELITVKVDSVKARTDGNYIFMSSFPFFDKLNRPRYLTIKENGEIDLAPEVNIRGRQGPYIPATENFKKGYQWDFGWKGYVNDGDVTVTTETGTFEGCYFVLITDGFTFSHELWFKKDVGIVKWGSNRTNPPTLKPIYYVLKEYKLN